MQCFITLWERAHPPFISSASGVGLFSCHVHEVQKRFGIVIQNYQLGHALSFQSLLMDLLCIWYCDVTESRMNLIFTPQQNMILCNFISTPTGKKNIFGIVVKLQNCCQGGSSSWSLSPFKKNVSYGFVSVYASSKMFFRSISLNQNLNFLFWFQILKRAQA